MFSPTHVVSKAHTHCTYSHSHTHTHTHTHTCTYAHTHTLVYSHALSHAHTMQGNLRCELFYRQAIQLRPNYTAAWTNLGLVLLNTGENLYNNFVVKHHYITTKALFHYAITKVSKSPIAFDIKYFFITFFGKRLPGDVQLIFTFLHYSAN